MRCHDFSAFSFSFLRHFSLDRKLRFFLGGAVGGGNLQATRQRIAPKARKSADALIDVDRVVLLQARHRLLERILVRGAEALREREPTAPDGHAVAGGREEEDEDDDLRGGVVERDGLLEDAVEGRAQLAQRDPVECGLRRARDAVVRIGDQRAALARLEEVLQLRAREARSVHAPDAGRGEAGETHPDRGEPVRHRVHPLEEARYARVLVGVERPADALLRGARAREEGALGGDEGVPVRGRERVLAEPVPGRLQLEHRRLEPVRRARRHREGLRGGRVRLGTPGRLGVVLCSGVGAGGVAVCLRACAGSSGGVKTRGCRARGRGRSRGGWTARAGVGSVRDIRGETHAGGGVRRLSGLSPARIGTLVACSPALILCLRVLPPPSAVVLRLPTPSVVVLRSPSRTAGRPPPTIVVVILLLVLLVVLVIVLLIVLLVLFRDRSGKLGVTSA